MFEINLLMVLFIRWSQKVTKFLSLVKMFSIIIIIIIISKQ